MSKKQDQQQERQTSLSANDRREEGGSSRETAGTEQGIKGKKESGQQSVGNPNTGKRDDRNENENTERPGSGTQDEPVDENSEDIL